MRRTKKRQVRRVFLPFLLAVLFAVPSVPTAWSVPLVSASDPSGHAVVAPVPAAAWSMARKEKQAENLAASVGDLSISPKSPRLPWVATSKTPGYKHLSIKELKSFKPRAAASPDGKDRQPSLKTLSAGDWPAGHPYIAHARSFSFESPYIDPGTVAWFATWDVNPDLPSSLTDGMAVVVILHRASDDSVVDVQQWAAWESNGYGTWYNSLLEEGVKYYAEVQYDYADGTVDTIKSNAAPAMVNGGVPADAAQSCPGAPNSSGVPGDLQKYCGDPVDTATGAFGETSTDARGIAPGLAFQLSRTYSSASDADGVLGKGWAFPYSASLDIGQSVVSFHAEDGSQADYNVNTDGSLTPNLPYARSVLAKTSTGYVLTAPDQHTLVFNTAGRLTAMRDPAGVGLTFGYTGDELTSAMDAGGRTTTLAYSGAHLSAVTLPGLGTVSYGYTGGLLTSVTGLNGKATTYVYDTASRLATVTDALGKTQSSNVFDSAGRVTTQANALAGKTTYRYDGSTTFVTQPDGGIWTYVYNGGVISSKSDPFGKVTKYAYDSSLNRTSVTDPKGAVSTTTYNAGGNVLTATAPSTLSYKQTWTYDTRNNVTSYTDGRLNKTTYTYNTANQLTATTGPDGGKTAYTYNALNELATSTTPRGETTTYTYDSAGNRLSVTTPAGHKTTYVYNDANRVTQQTSPGGSVASYTYDASGNTTSSTDPDGKKTAYTYDTVGNELTVTDPAGNTTAYTYDAAGDPLTVTDAAGNVTKQAYDTSSHLLTVTDAAGHKTSYTYDKAGRKLTAIAPRGNVAGATAATYTTTYGYDANGNIVTVADPTGAVTTTTYDVVNRPTKVTDALGNATTTTYDANGNVTKTTDALGKAVSSSYDKQNRLGTRTDQLGKVTNYTYDADGNLLTSVSPLGETSSWAYDADGRQTTAVEPRGNATGATAADYTTRYGYDADGNPTMVTDPLGGVTKTTYDPAGLVTSLTDPDKRVTGYEYDAQGQPTKVTAPDGGTTGYTYDSSGNVTKRTDADGHATTYAYDAVHQLTRTTDPLGRATSYTYDPDGNQLTQTTPLGTITATHDARDLLTRTDYSDTTPDITYGYDADGRMTSRTNGVIAEDFAYDAIGQLTKTRGFQYAYDAAGNMLTRKYSDGSTLTYTYNADGRTATMAADGSTTAYAYDASGNLTKTTLPNTQSETRTYDQAGRLASVTAATAGTTLTKTAVTLDATGLPVHTDVTRANVGTGGWDTTYDAAGRVTGGCFPQPWVTGCPATRTTSYTYDKAGNRLTSALGSTSTNYTYDNADELTSTTTGSTTTAYKYNGNGDQTAAGANTYNYNLAGQITSATVGSATTAYQYDASGDQVVASQAGKIINRRQWDPNAPIPSLTTEYDTDWNIKESYRYNPLGEVAAVQTAAGTPYYYDHDTQGSPLDVSNSSGTLNQRWAYDPYGTRVLNTQASGAPASTPSFTGAYYDTTTGYLDLHARQLDTTTGRFTSTDPLTPGQGAPSQSAYAYANNQPTYLSDPSGQCWWISGSGNQSCWTAKIPGTDLIPLSPALNAIGNSIADTCKNGSSYAASQGRWAWTGCVDEFTGINSFRKSSDCISVGSYGQGALWGLNGVGTAGLSLLGGPEGSTAEGLPGVAASGDWPLSVGNLRFGPGGGGAISAYGGIPYKTPITSDLQKAVNPFKGQTNCRACAVATDQLLAGKGVSVAPKDLQAGSVGPIEKIYGEQFKSASLASVVREVSRGGPGARGIVWAALPSTYRGADSHVFNVVNVGGDVVFLDAQQGQARLDKINVLGFLRTG